jgi:hypothetical protein
MTENKQVFDRQAYMKEYNKKYYQNKRAEVIRLVIDRKSLLRGSDQFRQQLVEDLNSGKRKFVKQPTRERLQLIQDPKTLRWS